MRDFEILFVLAGLASLGLLAWRSTRALWLGSAAADVAVLVAHLVSEGARWQLALAYVFVGLLTLTACAKTLGVAWPFRCVIKGPVVGASAVSLLVTAFLASVLPVFTLPPPTGPYAVGVQYLDVTDSTRRLAPYFGSPQTVHLFTTFLSLPDFAFDPLTLVRTSAWVEPAVADAEPTYPVVVFSHGAGMSLETQTAQSQDLASHGYVVAAIDHTYVSAGTVFPGRSVTAHDATTSFDTPEPAGPITQIMADDVGFVLDQLSALNAGVAFRRAAGPDTHRGHRSLGRRRRRL